MTFLKNANACAFKTHQRCTIITCDTSQFLGHIRCEIHSVFIDETWHTHKHKHMHKVGTIAVFWTSSPTKFTRDNLMYSILKTVSSKVRWIASRVPLRQSQIKFNWGVSQVSPLKTIKSKPRKAISRKGYWISAEVNSLHIMSSKFPFELNIK